LYISKILTYIGGILPLEWVEGGPACLAKFLRAAANDLPPGDGGGGACPIRFGINVRFEPELVGWGLTKPKKKLFILLFFLIYKNIYSIIL